MLPLVSHASEKTAEAVFFICPYFSTDGSHVAMPGKKQRSAISSTMMKAKGAEPAMISWIELSSLMPLMTKRFMPTGGVMRASSILIRSTTLNQMGSKPSALMIG